jgi:hypothetical protein
MGLAGGVSGSENIAHAARLKKFVREHPFGSRLNAKKQ